MLEFAKHVSRRHVNTGDRLGRDDNSPHRSRRFCNGVEHALVEELGVGEKERSIPTKQYQAGNATRGGITLDVVVAPNTIDSAEHCEMWAPAIPQELDDRNNYGDPNAGDHTEHRNADKTDNRQPEFQLLNAEDATQVCEFEQADGRGDHDRGE